MSGSIHTDGGRRSGPVGGVMNTPIVVGSVALLSVLLCGWIWSVRGHADLGMALRASELRDDLREAHTSLLGAHVDLYERNFRSARHQAGSTPRMDTDN